MCDPWYEMTAMPIEEARRILCKEFILTSAPDIAPDIVTAIVLEIVPDNTVMCSYRGYYTFQHQPFINLIGEKLKEKAQPEDEADK